MLVEEIHGANLAVWKGTFTEFCYYNWNVIPAAAFGDS